MAEAAPACVFCEILAGRLPASTVHHDALCSAFLDIHPINPGHLLILPNVHFAGLAELEPGTGAHLFGVAQRLALAVRRSGVRCEGVDLFLADGAAAGQDVFHVHLHVIPRFEHDGFGFRFSPAYDHPPERSALDALAEQIRRAL